MSGGKRIFLIGLRSMLVLTLMTWVALTIYSIATRDSTMLFQVLSPILAVVALIAIALGIILLAIVVILAGILIVGIVHLVIALIGLIKLLCHRSTWINFSRWLTAHDKAH